MVHRVRVAAVLVKEGKILLVRHVHPVSGFEWWVPPGGGIETVDKDIHSCAAREVWEETGYRIKTGDILYLREFYDIENDTLNLEIFLEGRVTGGELTITNIQGNGPDEHYIKEVKWVNRDEIGELIVFPEIMKSEEFWENPKSSTRYLGRQEG